MKNNGKFGKEPIPKNWRKIGRHSLQGFTLGDLVGALRLQKIATDVRLFGIKVTGTVESIDDILYRMDINFRKAFFAGIFGGLSMPDAAVVYVDYLEEQCEFNNGGRSEENDREMFRHSVKETLQSCDPMRFFRHCLHFGWPIPETKAAALKILHRLRLETDWLPDSEKEKSRVYLQSSQQKGKG